MIESISSYLNNSSVLLKIKLNLIQDDRAIPFVPIDTSRPYVRILKTMVSTLGDAVIKDAFMMIPKDEYSQPQEDFSGITNTMLEEIWQILAEGLSDVSGYEILNSKDKSSGRFMPFSPVFFCKKINKYFEPVCPSCSSVLELCRDDGLLSDSNLASYSQSLKRYMYCPGCHANGKQDVFYTATRMPDDPLHVGDRFKLIKEYINLLIKSGSTIPCVDCEWKTRCFGEEWLALDTIVPLSFYPFYAMLSDAATMNASDFLMILSGARIDDVSAILKARGFTGRLEALRAYNTSRSSSQLLLFGNDERAFLEVLYLKIAFVSDLLQLVKRLAKNQSVSGMCFGKESVWVNIAENADLLPAFWNFKAILLSCPDISGNQGLLPDMPKSYMSYWFGRIIIDALISNPSASGAPLNMAIKTAIGLYENGQPYEEIFESDAFRPENIFYYAGVRNIRDEWAEIWRRVLSIGLSMILSGYTGDNDIQENELTSNLSELMKEIKKMLFSEGVFTAASSAAIQPSQSEDIDSRIIEILENIKAKWLTSSDINMQKTQETKPAIDEEEFEKTVMMSTAGPVQSPNYEASHEETKDIHETVILNAATLAGLAKKAVRKADIKVESTPENEDPLEATIIMSEKMKGAQNVSKPPSLTEEKPIDINNESDELTETVIIKKGN